MDPNANLAEIRSIVADAYRLEARDEPLPSDDASRLVDLFSALDTWLSKGGFLPFAWGSRFGSKAENEIRK